MFRKPVRTYLRKKGTFDHHPASSTSTIIRDELPPDEIIQTPAELTSNINGSLDYDPFDTTFDRLVRDVIVHPIPQDQMSNQSYDDSSDDAVMKKNSFSDASDDPLLYEPLTSPSPQPRRAVKKLGNNKRQRLGSEKPNETAKSRTETIRRRVKVKPKTNFKDENEKPNSELDSHEKKRKNVRKKRVLKKRPMVEDVATASSHISTERKILENSKILKQCNVSLERLSFPFDSSTNSKNPGTNKRKKIRPSNNDSADGREIYPTDKSISTSKTTNSVDYGSNSENSESSENPPKRSMELAKNASVLLSKVLTDKNQEPVDSFDWNADNSASFDNDEKLKNRLKRPVDELSSEASKYNERFVHPTGFQTNSNDSESEESDEKRKMILTKKPLVSLWRNTFVDNEQPVKSTDFETTSNKFESKENEEKQKTILVKKPAVQWSKKKVSTINEESVDSIDIGLTFDNSNSPETEYKRKKTVENPVVLSRDASTNNEQSVDSSDFGVSSENVEPVEIQQKKGGKLFKKPVVSLSRLSFPKRVSSHFSSSTPIVTRVMTGNSLLRLSPIKSHLNEDLEEPFDLGTESLARKFSVKAVDAIPQQSTSSLTIKSNRESKSLTGKCRPGILSVTPDPDPSELLFNDTEVAEAANDGSVSPKPRSDSEMSHASANSSSVGFEKESSNRETSHLIFDKTEESFRFSSSVSSSNSSICNEDSIENTENSTKDPFMGCPDEQVDIPKKQSLGEKSRNSDDDWITISGSVSISGSKSLFETRENFEQLSSGDNTSSDEITEFVKAHEITNGQNVSPQNESSVEICHPPKVDSSDNSTDNLGKSEISSKSNENDSLEKHRPFQAIVLLSRLTRSKINKLKNNHDSLEGNVSQAMESLSQSNADENLTTDGSVAESESINEMSSKKLKSMSLNDSEELPIDMESVGIDYSSLNTSEKSSVHETSDNNLNDSSRSTVANVSLKNEVTVKIKDLPQEQEDSDAPESKDFTRADKLQNRSANNKSLEDARRDSMQPVVLLSRLNDSFRITRRRNKYHDWGLKLSAISEVEAEKVATENNKIEEATSGSKMGDIQEDLSQATTISLGTESSQILHQISQKTDESCSTSFTPSQPNDSAKEDKVVFLKPGKSWARSLSILNHVHSQEDLEFFAVGKGKKWRQSVQNILEMQQQGLIQSCVKKNEDSKELSLFTGLRNSTAWIPGSSQPDTSRLFGISSPGRFIRRVSIRVVPDCKSFDNIKDSAFLQAYGINPIENKQTTTQRSTLIDLPKTVDDVPKTLCNTKPRDVVLAQCGQKSSLPFNECYPQSFLENCRKIGEGVYGEVFLYEKGKEKNVIKIIPIEGDIKINSERQKKFDEILSEIVIAKELHNLRFTDKSNTNCFVEVKKIRCVKGKYPKILIDLWKTFDEEKNSENDCPSIFEEDQLYIVLELGHGGEDLEAYVFQNAREAYALFMQTALALAVAEETLEFEHRDLHWGNLLISRTDESHIDFKLNNKSFSLLSRGVKVSVIDFTLSRMSYEGCSIFNDLSMDEDLFVAQGEYQFDIYRLMRNKLENNWQRFEPYTNILWLHYILDKMITAARYRRKNTKVHKTGIFDLQVLKNEILEYNSAVDFVTNCDKATRLQSDGMVATACNKNMQDFGAPIKKAEPEVVPMNTMFEAYCRMDPLSDEKKVNLLPLSQLNVWLTSARILDMSRVTTTDTGLAFFKFRKRAISYDEFLAFVKDLTSTKRLDFEDTKKKMQTCGIPVHPRDFKVKADKK